MSRSATAVIALFLCIALVPRGFAQSAGDRLKVGVTVTAADPFDPSNAQQAAPVKVTRGQSVLIQVTAAPKAGFHTYPVILPAGHEQVELSKVRVGAVKGFVPMGTLAQSPEPVAVTVEEPQGKRKVLEFATPVTWTQEVRVANDAPSGRVEIPVKVDTQVCDESKCLPVHVELKAAFEVIGASSSAVVADKQPAVKDETPTPPAQPAQPAAAKKKGRHEPIVGLISVSSEAYAAQLKELSEQIVKAKPAAPAGTQGSVNAEGGNDLLSFMLAGIFWGGISLITPCVFPMIPITVSFFLKQSEKEHHRPIVMASVYSLTIVVVLTLAAAFMLSVFRWLSINPIMNYALGGLFVFFALSLFGMYEIELPSGLARFTSAREGQGGLVGTMFMALTFTIISFACVAPFLGGFGGTAAAARPMWHNLLGGLAYSATFAAPFFFLALFPTLLKAMPKSGSWLNSVKVVMGFLELAAAFKFFRGAELLQSSGDITLFSYDFVLGIWIALAVLCGFYLIGLFRLPHDTPAESIGVPRLLFSAAFFGLALYLTPALFKVNNEGAGQRPGGAVYAWVDAFLLPESRRGKEENVKTGDLYYAVEQAREHLKKTGEPQRIFVDFTGVVCSNCRYNEQNVFPLPEVKKAMTQYLTVEVYTDSVPLDLYAPTVQAELAKDKSRSETDAQANAAFEEKVFGEITLPLYAILEPQADNRILIVDVYNEGRVMNVAEFTRFVTGNRARDNAQFAAAR